MNLITRLFFAGIFCLFANYIESQNTTAIGKADSSNGQYSREHRTRLLYSSIGYQIPMATGDNFIGQGLKGKSGFDIKTHIYIYKQFFIGFAYGGSYFNVKDQTAVGSYDKTTLLQQHFYIGYEFLPLDKIRLGVNASLFGNARFKNDFENNGREAHQIDGGNLNSFGLYINYEIWDYLMVYIDYSFRSSKTKIDVPAELKDTFGKGTYSTIGIGLAFTLGNNDLISQFRGL